jgi:hypothetical protein
MQTFENNAPTFCLFIEKKTSENAALDLLLLVPGRTNCVVHAQAFVPH